MLQASLARTAPGRRRLVSSLVVLKQLVDNLILGLAQHLEALLMQPFHSERPEQRLAPAVVASVATLIEAVLK